MSRFLVVLVIGLVLSGCAGRYRDAPDNLDNACSIITERPSYVRGLRAAKRNWNVEPSVLMAIIYQESKFISGNRPPQQYALGVIPTGRASSARGYSQALDGTWDDYKKATGNRTARRTNFADAVDFMGWYLNGTKRALGISLNDTRNQYLAYHEGRGGYSRGSYRAKGWLVDIANDIAARERRYRSQLQDCRRARF